MLNATMPIVIIMLMLSIPFSTYSSMQHTPLYFLVVKSISFSGASAGALLPPQSHFPSVH